MNDQWRPQATIAVAFTVLLALLLLACWQFDGAPWAAGGMGAAMLVAFVFIVVGIVSGILGTFKGSPASRAASLVCIFLLASPVLAVGALIAWIVITKPRFA